MNNRLKLVRSGAGMTQAQFAEALGTSRTAYAKYENGLVIPSDTFIHLLCDRFHISEKWIRTGEGEMKAESDEEMLGRIAKELNLTPIQSKIFHYLMSLPDEKRDAVSKAFFTLLKSGMDLPPVEKESHPPETEADVKRKIVNSELDAEAKGKTS